MYKTAIIGDRDSVLCFMALGFSVYEAESAEEAAQALHKLAKEESVAVIFIIEDLARRIEEDILKYKDAPLPAITVIPGKRGSSGYGVSNMRDAVVRAVGADILFNE